MATVSDDAAGEAAGLRRQGSLRRVLPSPPGAPDPAQRIDRPSLSSASELRFSSQYAPYFVEYSIIPEFNMLESQKLPGVYVIPSAKSPLVWFGVMFIRQGLYQGGVFRFTLHIPENFPDGSCPKLDFQLPMFHPLVCPVTGQMDIAREFADWNKNVNRLWQVVDFSRKAFLKIDTQSPVNAEAARMFESEPELFAAAAAECAQSSQLHLYDPPPTDDPHYLQFEQYDSAVHDPIKNSILNPKDGEGNNKSPRGLSWVSVGSLKPFSKSPSSTEVPRN